MEKRIFVFPRWVSVLYVISAIILIPWTYSLAKNLPDRQLANHWDAAWIGYDFFMVILLLTTVYLAIKRSIWLPLAATSLATVFLLDAWFDVLTAKPGSQQNYALLLAVLIELPLAILTFYFAYKTTLTLHEKISSKR
jgi:hypothetical protein